LTRVSGGWSDVIRRRGRCAGLLPRRREGRSMKRWHIERVAWGRFDPAKVDPD
jgi:hypothetical protein